MTGDPGLLLNAWCPAFPFCGDAIPNNSRLGSGKGEFDGNRAFSCTINLKINSS